MKAFHQWGSLPKIIVEYVSVSRNSIIDNQHDDESKKQNPD